MSADLPDYYFRVRDNGAFVFRVDTENRHRRIEMDQIAVVNIRNGEIKAHGDRDLSAADMAAIRPASRSAKRPGWITFRPAPTACRLPGFPQRRRRFPDPGSLTVVRTWAGATALPSR